MKKIALILMVISVLALVGLGACGGNGDNEETSQTTQATTTSEETTTQATTTQETSNGGGGGLTWNDMPVYGGADQIQKGSWAFPSDEGEYSKVEWRYYETGDDIGDVTDFYSDKMPDNGWDQVMWGDMGEMTYGFYMKNNEKDIAYVWIVEEDGDTVIAMMRGSE